jgi:hypothetical protein
MIFAGGLIALPFLLALAAVTNTDGKPPSVSQPAAAQPIKKTNVAAPALAWGDPDAEVGDNIALRYPTSTVMCPSQDDAFQVYMAETWALAALMETARIERSTVSASGAAAALDAARKETMPHLYRCEWASHGDVYLIEQKRISGTDKANALHTVAYCLRPINGSSCRWIVKSAAHPEPFVNVLRPALNPTAGRAATRKAGRHEGQP